MVDEEPEETEEAGDSGADGEWEDYPWRRAVAASHDKEDLDSWPCPSCKHPLAFHAVRGSTVTNAFAKVHGQDYRYSCDAWLFEDDGEVLRREETEIEDFHGHRVYRVGVE